MHFATPSSLIAIALLGRLFMTSAVAQVRIISPVNSPSGSGRDAGSGNTNRFDPETRTACIETARPISSTPPRTSPYDRDIAETVDSTITGPSLAIPSEGIASLRPTITTKSVTAATPVILGANSPVEAFASSQNQPASVTTAAKKGVISRSAQIGGGVGSGAGKVVGGTVGVAVKTAIVSLRSAVVVAKVAAPIIGTGAAVATVATKHAITLTAIAR